MPSAFFLWRFSILRLLKFSKGTKTSVTVSHRLEGTALPTENCQYCLSVLQKSGVLQSNGSFQRFGKNGPE